MQVLTENIVNEINQQIGRELFNSNQYLAIASYFRDKALFNIADEYQKEAEGEREHAQKFINFLTDHRGKLSIPSLNQPINEFASGLDAARSALVLELSTTQYIYDLANLAQASGNLIVYNFMLWFISEQQEEIATANDRISIIERCASNLQIADDYFKDAKA